ncbi:Motility protein A [Gammaproteobacteria bacterium]
MFVIIGYVIILGAVVGGFIMAGGHVGILIQPIELLIIFGSAFGAFFAANSLKVIMSVVNALGAALKGSKYNKELYMELMVLLFSIFTKIRKSGLISIEDDVENPHNSPLFQAAPKILADHHAVDFITDYLRLISGGNMDVHQIDSLMEMDIETHHHELEMPIHALQNLGDGMPAFGIVAAVMGVVHTMQSVGLPPAELGKLIAAALVGTFLGILAAYGFINPLVGLLGHQAQESTKFYEAIRAGLVAYLNESAPPVAVEFARKVIFSSERPSFKELESRLKASKGS